MANIKKNVARKARSYKKLKGWFVFTQHFHTAARTCYKFGLAIGPTCARKSHRIRPSLPDGVSDAGSIQDLIFPSISSNIALRRAYSVVALSALRTTAQESTPRFLPQFRADRHFRHKHASANNGLGFSMSPRSVIRTASHKSPAFRKAVPD